MILVRITDYGRPVRISPSLHGRKSNLILKFLGTAEAYQPKISDLFDLCLHWMSVFGWSIQRAQQ